jgi:subtilisin family serine protease
MLTAARWPRLTAAGLLLFALAVTAVLATPAAPAGADTVRNAQMWVLDAVSAPGAWQLTEGQGATVAVIDSGVSPDVSDLAGSVITGPDLTGVHTSPANPNWGVHGTWMASLIAGHGHAGGSSGIMGAAPHARVLSIRVVTDRHDPGYTAYQHETDSRVQTALARAISYATQRRVSVISMSLGYGQPSAVVRSALQAALNHGIVVVASSGNSGNSVGARVAGHAPYSFPADYPGVLGVAAVGRDGTSAGFSSFNLSVQVAAPGVNVPAQGRDGQYWLVSGTSPACALTAGVAALIKARYPHLAPALVVRAMTGSAQHRPRGGYDDRIGFGTVDAAAALTAAGRLAGHQRPASGTATTVHFGGGAAAVPPDPVQPRSLTGLITACLVGLACLAVAWLAGNRLLALRRAGRSRGQHAADPRQPPTAWPEPRVHAVLPRGDEAVFTRGDDPPDPPRETAPGGEPLRSTPQGQYWPEGAPPRNPPPQWPGPQS